MLPPGVLGQILQKRARDALFRLLIVLKFVHKVTPVLYPAVFPGLLYKVGAACPGEY